MSGQPRQATIWVGDSTGRVSIYQLTLPANDKRRIAHVVGDVSLPAASEEEAGVTAATEQITCLPGISKITIITISLTQVSVSNDIIDNVPFYHFRYFCCILNLSAYLLI